MKEAVIVAYGRSAIGKAPRGSLKYTRPDDLAAQVVQGTLAKIPEVEPGLIEDFVLGCAFPEAEQGMNLGRIVALRAGLPFTTAAQTVNRFCSSGLQALAIAANSIRTGEAEVVLVGGVESMSMIPMGGYRLLPNPYLIENYPETYLAMGLTAERVAAKYGISREMQDEFAAASHHKATKAQVEGKFDEEIIPVLATDVVEEDEQIRSESFLFRRDEGIRLGVTIEGLRKLKPVFQKDGTVTAGNASQMSDGAAIVLLMSGEMAKRLNLKPLAVFRSFAVAGVEPELMGIGPVRAIPKALKNAGLKQEDLDLIELNEAFAAQALACMQVLELEPQKVNVNGGAIALGHPLGCTGAFLTIKLISELKRRQGKYGLVSMCIGGGMRAAGVFELCQ